MGKISEMIRGLIAQPIEPAPPFQDWKPVRYRQPLPKHKPRSWSPWFAAMATWEKPGPKMHSLPGGGFTLDDPWVVPERSIPEAKEDPTMEETMQAIRSIIGAKE